MRADLHVHSIYSDGTLPPRQLAALAKKNGVELLSITDHDNFMGDEEKRRAISGMGIAYLTGVEISAYENKKKIHITGYGFDLKNPLAGEYQRQFYEHSVVRLEDVIEKLAFYKDIRLTKEDVFAAQKVAGIPVHTMHVVLAVLKKGYYRSVSEVFADCFMPGLPTYSYVKRSTPAEAIDIIHSLGGIACIAHPGRIDLDKAEKEDLIFRLKEMGIDGIECDYTTHTLEQTEYFKGLAAKVGLLCSGGSDFHTESGRRMVGQPRFVPSEEFLRAAHVRN